MTRSPSPTSRLARSFRLMRLRMERIRLARRMRGLAGLLDVPHDVSAQAQARIARMRRRAQAVARILG